MDYKTKYYKYKLKYLTIKNVISGGRRLCSNKSLLLNAREDESDPALESEEEDEEDEEDDYIIISPEYEVILQTKNGVQYGSYVSCNCSITELLEVIGVDPDIEIIYINGKKFNIRDNENIGDPQFDPLIGRYYYLVDTSRS